MATIHLDDAFAADRELAAVVSVFQMARVAIDAIIVGVDRLGRELLPVAQAPGDDADQAYLALSGIIDSLIALDEVLRDVLRRI